MASLREHVAARKAGTEMSPVDAETYRQALERTYAEIKQDVWKGATPDEDEYVLVVIDRLVAHGRLQDEEYRKFCLLRPEIKRALALAVGP